MLTVPRDHPDYPWHHRPADHSVAGLFVDGPQEAGGVLARLIPETHCRETAPSPSVARAQQDIRRKRIQRLQRGIRAILAAAEAKATRHRRAA